MDYLQRVFDHRFNPRAREGRDVTSADVRVLIYDVSIHAPARGATRVIRYHQSF